MCRIHNDSHDRIPITYISTLRITCRKYLARVLIMFIFVEVVLKKCLKCLKWCLS